MNILDDLLESVKAQNLHILNVIIRQDGSVLAKHDFADEKPIHLWSASKTFTSMAIGIAESEGFFSIDDPILHYFEPRGQINDNLKILRIRDLLCMSTGHRNCPVTKAPERNQSLDDVESLFFEEPFVDSPGTHFKYDNSATYMLSKLITKRTGLSLRDYLVPRIFSPLGIEKPRWESDSSGICIGCTGLYLTASDLSKFGQLLLDHGEWNGNQLIPRKYVEEATKPQINTSDFDEPFATDDHWNGYGYQIWMNRFPGSYRVDGLLGQYAIVLPEKNAVVTFISNEPEKMTNIIELTWNTLLNKL